MINMSYEVYQILLNVSIASFILIIMALVSLDT
jgi:hypothetical protein